MRHISRISLIKYVKNFDFTHPRWDNLPMGFPDCDTSGLTQKQDRHLFDAIKTEWIVEGGGQGYFVKAVARRTAIAAAVIFVLFAGGRLITSSQITTNTVSAKTVSQTVGDFVEATMSAVFRK